MRLSDTDSIQI